VQRCLASSTPPVLPPSFLTGRSCPRVHRHERPWVSSRSLGLSGWHAAATSSSPVRQANCSTFEADCCACCFCPRPPQIRPNCWWEDASHSSFLEDCIGVSRNFLALPTKSRMTLL
jgi:hypothetical protein